MIASAVCSVNVAPPLGARPAPTEPASLPGHVARSPVSGPPAVESGGVFRDEPFQPEGPNGVFREELAPDVFGQVQVVDLNQRPIHV